MKKNIPSDDYIVLEWTCGHVGAAVCAECHRLLIVKANELQAKVDELGEKLAEITKWRSL